MFAKIISYGDAVGADAFASSAAQQGTPELFPVVYYCCIGSFLREKHQLSVHTQLACAKLSVAYEFSVHIVGLQVVARRKHHHQDTVSRCHVDTCLTGLETSYKSKSVIYDALEAVCWR